MNQLKSMLLKKKKEKRVKDIVGNHCPNHHLQYFLGVLWNGEIQLLNSLLQRGSDARDIQEGRGVFNK